MGTSSPIGILFAMDPTAPVKNEDGSYNKNAAWGKVTNPHLMLGGKDSDTALEWIQTKMFRSMTNADVTIKFCDKLSLNSIFGYDYVDNKPLNIGIATALTVVPSAEWVLVIPSKAA